MVAAEDRMHERAIDRPAIYRLEFGEPLAPLLERRRAFAGPDHGVEREPRHQFRMALGEQRGAQRAGGDAVNQQRPLAPQLLDIKRGRVAVVGAKGDRRVVIAVLGGAAIALHVDAPTVEAARGEPVHHRGIGPSRHPQVESRLRGHRGTVHEQDGAGGLGGIACAFLPQEQLHAAVLFGPMLLALDRRGGRLSHFIHRSPTYDAVKTRARTAESRSGVGLLSMTRVTGTGSRSRAERSDIPAPRMAPVRFSPTPG